MVSIKWCCKQKEGIKLIDSNENLSQAYIKMAEDSIGTMNREKKYNLRASISAGYYSMYYSLYAILMKLGIKCEIHSCALEFMKFALADFYSEQEIKIIKKAFNLRIIAQYYVDRIIDNAEADFITEQALSFLEKSKQVLLKINENDIKQIRDKINIIKEAK